MATNYDMERMIGRSYPESMKHIQELIMDCEKCHQAYGKKDWLGRSKFDKQMQKFFETVGILAHSLKRDGRVVDTEDTMNVLREINGLMLLCELAYGNWPHSFIFWKDWYSAVEAKTQRDNQL